MKKWLEHFAIFIAKKCKMIEINLLSKMNQFNNKKIKKTQEYGFNFHKVKQICFLMITLIENFLF